MIIAPVSWLPIPSYNIHWFTVSPRLPSKMTPSVELIKSFGRGLGTRFVWNLSKVIVFFVADMIEKNALEGITDYYGFLGKFKWLNEAIYSYSWHCKHFFCPLLCLVESLRRETTEGQWPKKAKVQALRRHKKNRSLKAKEMMEPAKEISTGESSVASLVASTPSSPPCWTGLIENLSKEFLISLTSLPSGENNMTKTSLQKKYFLSWLLLLMFHIVRIPYLWWSTLQLDRKKSKDVNEFLSRNV